MKKIPSILISIVGMFAVGCNDSGGDNVNPNNKTDIPENLFFGLDKESVSISPDGGSVDVIVYSNYKWEISGTSDWCTPSMREGEANEDGQTVTFSADLTYDTREAIFWLRCVDEKIKLKVSQEFKEAILADENNKFTIPGEGGSIEITYRTTVECEVVIPDDAQGWISVAPATRGLFNGNTTLIIAENTAYRERNAVVQVVKVGDNTLFTEYIISQVRQNDGVFVLCEGFYGADNSSLYHYNHKSKEVTTDVLNGVKVGGEGSLYMYNDLLFVVVCDSGIVFALDHTTGEVKGMIDNLTSPRFVAIDGTGTKGYISQMYTNKLITFDPRTLERTGSITLEGVAGSEQMAVVGDKLFIASWIEDYKITVLDTDTDEQIKRLGVGVQPYSMVLDKNNTLWIVCDGGNEYSQLPEGVTMEAPSLWKLNTKTLAAQKVHEFAQGSYFRSRLTIDGKGENIYFISDERCWVIDVATGKLPTESFISIEGCGLLGIGVDPVSGEIYVADTKNDYSNGEVFRYSPEGELIDTFEVGILPSSFAFFSE